MAVRFIKPGEKHPTGWYYLNEYNDPTGPFKTEKDAQTALDKYIEWVDDCRLDMRKS